jgi:hypothetical protein
MRKMIFAVAFAVLGFLTTEASAVTVLTTTQGDVKKECGGQTVCTAPCGGTLCSYYCKDPSQQCTVTVFLKKPKGSVRPTGSAASAKASMQ